MRRLSRPVVAHLVVGGLLLTGCTDPASPDAGTVGPARPAAESAEGTSPVEPRAVRLLHAWDERRAAAYSSGDVTALRSLYAPGSRAGDRDVRALRGYVERGLVVRGLRTQVLSLQVRRDRASVVRLMVVDRVVAGRVVTASRVVALPRDAADPRIVTLVSTPRHGWVVRAVRPVR